MRIVLVYGAAASCRRGGGLHEARRESGNGGLVLLGDWRPQAGNARRARRRGAFGGLDGPVARRVWKSRTAPQDN